MLLPVALLLLVLIPLLIMPLVAMFVFASGAGWHGFIQSITSPDAQFALRFSLLIALASSLINIVFGTFAAYVLSRYRFPGRQALIVIVNLPVAIPTVVVGTSLLLLWGPIGLLGRYLDPMGIQPMFTAAGVLLAHLFVTFPYMLGAIKPVLDELERTYEEAAYTLGAGRWTTFRLVTLPSLKTALFSGSLLTFAHSLGEFGATVMVSGNLRMRTQTAPLFIYAQFESGRIEQASAVAAVLALLSFCLFIVLIRYTQRRAR